MHVLQRIIFGLCNDDNIRLEVEDHSKVSPLYSNDGYSYECLRYILFFVVPAELHCKGKTKLKRDGRSMYFPFRPSYD